MSKTSALLKFAIMPYLILGLILLKCYLTEIFFVKLSEGANLTDFYLILYMEVPIVIYILSGLLLIYFYECYQKIHGQRAALYGVTLHGIIMIMLISFCLFGRFLMPSVPSPFYEFVNSQDFLIYTAILFGICFKLSAGCLLEKLREKKKGSENDKKPLRL